MDEIRGALQADLHEAQAGFEKKVVGRLLTSLTMSNDTATAFRHEGILYSPDVQHLNYLVQDDVNRAVMHNRTEAAFTDTIMRVAPNASRLAVILRGGIYTIDLPPTSNHAGRQNYGVVALCEEAWASDTQEVLDIAEEARMVRAGLLGNESCYTPRLWLGYLAMKPDLHDFALEQLELAVPGELPVGEIKLIVHH